MTQLVIVAGPFAAFIALHRDPIMVRAQVRIGISGWRYDGWRCVFYPEKLAQARERLGVEDGRRGAHDGSASWRSGARASAQGDERARVR